MYVARRFVQSVVVGRHLNYFLYLVTTWAIQENHDRKL